MWYYWFFTLLRGPPRYCNDRFIFALSRKFHDMPSNAAFTLWVLLNVLVYDEFVYSNMLVDVGGL